MKPLTVGNSLSILHGMRLQPADEARFWTKHVLSCGMDDFA